MVGFYTVSVTDRGRFSFFLRTLPLTAAVTLAGEVVPADGRLVAYTVESVALATDESTRLAEQIKRKSGYLEPE
jgi:hypothetical protein